jgi:multicomponent K+:H+ antiporter subunit G
MTFELDVLVAALILIGAFFTFVGSLGLARLPDFYMRLHGPTKATTLGVGALILAYIVFFFGEGEGLPLYEVLITFFLFLTAPVSAHLLSRAALVRQVHSVTGGSDTGDGHRRPESEPGADEPHKVPVPPAAPDSPRPEPGA